MGPAVATGPKKGWKLNERHLRRADRPSTRPRPPPSMARTRSRIWRRSFDIPPPPLAPGGEFDLSADRRYAGIAISPTPKASRTRSPRVLPYWEGGRSSPTLKRGERILISAHGNSLARAGPSISRASRMATSPALENPRPASPIPSISSTKNLRDDRALLPLRAAPERVSIAGTLCLGIGFLPGERTSRDPGDRPADRRHHGQASSDWEVMRHAARDPRRRWPFPMRSRSRLGPSHAAAALRLCPECGWSRASRRSSPGAGGAGPILPGMAAAMTRLPVLGVPVESKALSGLDSLLSRIVQMPAGRARRHLRHRPSGAQSMLRCRRREWLATHRRRTGREAWTNGGPRQEPPRWPRRARVIVPPGSTIGILGGGPARTDAGESPPSSSAYRVHPSTRPKQKRARPQMSAANGSAAAWEDDVPRLNLASPTQSTSSPMSFENIPVRAAAPGSGPAISGEPRQGRAGDIAQDRLTEKRFQSRRRAAATAPFSPRSTNGADDLDEGIGPRSAPQRSSRDPGAWAMTARAQGRIASLSDAQRRLGRPNFPASPADPRRLSSNFRTMNFSVLLLPHRRRRGRAAGDAARTNVSQSAAFFFDIDVTRRPGRDPRPVRMRRAPTGRSRFAEAAPTMSGVPCLRNSFRPAPDGPVFNEIGAGGCTTQGTGQSRGARNQPVSNNHIRAIWRPCRSAATDPSPPTASAMTKPVSATRPNGWPEILADGPRPSAIFTARTRPRPPAARWATSRD